MQHHRDDGFYAWWTWNTLVVDNYAFQGADLHRDIDLVLPPGAMLGETGMFLYFMSFEFLCFLEYLPIYDFFEGYVIFLWWLM